MQTFPNSLPVPMSSYRVLKRLIDMNMTQRELADKIGVQETFLSNMLKGRKAGNVYWARIEQILGLSLKDIS